VAERALIRIRDQFKSDASRLFESFGFAPPKIEERGDGEARFVFANAAAELLPALEAIPQEWWAVGAIVRGEGNA
jgi:hypothetical protein